MGSAKKGIARTVKFQVLALMLLAAVVPCFILTAMMYKVMVVEFESSADRELQTIAESTKYAVESYMSGRVKDIRAMAALPGIAQALDESRQREHASTMLQRLAKAYGSYHIIALIDREGMAISLSQSDMVGKSMSADTTFQKALSGKVAVGDLHQSKELAQANPKSMGWTLTIATPVKAGDNVIGVLMADLNWTGIEKIIRGIAVCESGYVYVLDRKNRLIVHPVRRLYGNTLTSRNLSLPELDAAVKSRKKIVTYEFTNAMTGKIDQKMVGLAYTGKYGELPELGWTIGAGADASELMGYSKKVFRTTAMIVLAVLVMMIVVGVIAATVIARSVRRATESVGISEAPSMGDREAQQTIAAPGADIVTEQDVLTKLGALEQTMKQTIDEFKLLRSAIRKK